MDFSQLLQSIDDFIGQDELLEWLHFILAVSLSYLLLHWMRASITKRIPPLASSVYLFELWKKLLKATTRLFLIGVALFFGARIVELNAQFESLLLKVSMITFWIQMAFWLSAAIGYGTEHYANRHKEDASAPTVARMVSFMLRVLGMLLIVIIVLDNVGFDVTTLIASLGIGGIAVALAVQNILGDLLASLSLTLDKPFVVGDFIVMDNFMGTVENIGLKTTRLRSLSGEQIIFPNAELLKGKIRNYKRMYERRIVFSFTIRYDTQQEILEQIPPRVKSMIQSQDKTRFDRCHLFQFGDFGFIYETVYFVLVPDYNQYMDIQQAVNLQLVKTVHELGTEFASLLQVEGSSKAAVASKRGQG
ncbi:MAG TPA: mechanosensitive ion channel family protein [Dongiaceae bacterium]|nr:mechanosensitive ion channel family protein [Dongiaceae bacterium]